jgi:hypothetical protein
MKQLHIKDWGEPPKGDPKLPQNWDCSICGQLFWPNAAHGNRFYTNHRELDPPIEVRKAFDEHDCRVLLSQEAVERERHRKPRRKQ